MATSGDYSISTDNQYIVGTLHWEVTSQSIENNTSSLYVSLKLSRTNSYETYGSGTFWVGVDDQSSDNGLSFTITQDSNTMMVDGSFTVSHWANGDFWIYVKCGGSSNVVNINEFCSPAGSNSLPTIPRTSSTHIPDDVTLGDVCAITVDRASSDFTHDLVYDVNGTTGSIASGVTTAYNWTPPVSLSSSITKSDVVVCWITTTTKSGSTIIGTARNWVRLHVPESVVPTASAVYSEPTNYSATYDSQIQGKSTIRVITTANGAYGSSISSIVTTIDGKTYTGADITTAVISTSGSVPLSTIITDSRGRTCINSTTFTVANYYSPLIKDAAVWRCNSDGSDNDDGDYVIIKWTDMVRKLPNYSRTFAIQYKKTTDYSYTSFNGLYAQLVDGSNSEIITVQTDPINMSSDYAFDVVIVVYDSLGSSTPKALPVSTGYTILDIDETGRKIAFGKVASLVGVDFGLDLYFDGVALKTYIGGLMHPIGTIYISVVNDNPSTLFGGTWVAWGSGRVPVGVDITQSEFNPVEKTGGNKLLQSHNHTTPVFSSTLDIETDGATELWVKGGKPTPTTYGTSGLGTLTGGGDSQNLQPYITCYMWKRTA